jgi:TolA-binding protein
VHKKKQQRKGDHPQRDLLAFPQQSSTTTTTTMAFRPTLLEEEEEDPRLYDSEIFNHDFYSDVDPLFQQQHHHQQRFLQETNQTTYQNNQSFNDAATLRNTLRIYGILFLVVLVVFCWLRQKYPRVYNLRNWVPELETPLAKKQYGFFGWMYQLYLLSDSELLDECGMDALCYTRVLELGVKLAAMGMVVSLVLIPVYVTAPVGSETEGITDIVVRMSTTNVPSGDYRFLATVIGAYCIFGYAMYNILYEFEWFYMMRFQFLKKALPRNYTVYVRCIPDDFMSQTTLRRYFERFAQMGGYSISCDYNNNNNYKNNHTSGVLESTIALETPNLKKKVAEREKVLEQLEHAINIEEVKGTIPQDRNTGQSKVDMLWDQLDALNDEITAMIEYIEELQQSQDRQEEVRLLNEAAEEQSIVSSSETPLVASTKQTSLAHSTSVPTTTIGDDDGGGSEVPEGTEKVGGNGNTDSFPSLSRHTAAGSAAKLVGSFANRAANTVGAAANTVSKTATVAAGAATGAVTGVAGAALALFSSEDGKPMTAGFVTFTNLQATHAAMQMIQYPQPFAMEVLEAPSPNDIIWSNVGKKHKELQIGKLISFSLTTLLCLFWTIPMSFISSLSTIEGLREIDWIDRMLEALPWLEPVLAQLAPLLIVAANLALKIILEYLSMFEGPISGAVVQASLFGKLAQFMIIQTFFVSAISGSLFSQVTAFFEGACVGGTMLRFLLCLTIAACSFVIVNACSLLFVMHRHDRDH